MRGSGSVDGDSDVRLMFYPPLPSTVRRRLALGRLAIRFASRAGRGFTLVELLVVVAIIGALVALLLPAVQAARESSRRSQCANNLRQQGLALIGFEGEHRTLPVGCLDCLDDPKRFHSWNSQILPWLEQAPLRKQLDFTTPSYEAPNIGVGGTALDVFLCPSTLEQQLVSITGPWKKGAFTDYGGIYGVGGNGQDKDDEDWNKQNLKSTALGVFLYDEAVAFKDVTDGTSYTVACAELLGRRRNECEWVNGNNIFAQDAETPVNDAVSTSVGIGSPHSDGAQVAFCDGHVAFLSEQLEQQTLNALLTRAGEEPHHE
jgi:prepilin-type N-terminal cleavage/methylation domain-containing protein/prepilin-type processing-associated H-X9-DG protein